MFGHTLADFQLTQAALADMATDIDAAALLTYRAAWQRDVLQAGATREAAMAKLTATENAQRVIDRAVQLFGGAGVAKGNIVESLYREIRALRIYEGASEVQRLIIGRELLRKQSRRRATAGCRAPHVAYAGCSMNRDEPVTRHDGVTWTRSPRTTCRRAISGPTSASSCRSCNIPHT